MSKDTGGPAFPLVAETHEHVISIGVTLRDYFAATAMGGFAADPKMADVEAEVISRFAYMWADAMLAERSKQ